jgi:enoyl-CoA hydratase/carnithine racemase
MTDHVLIERRGAVQVIRINRPEKKNALTRAMYASMSSALAAGDEDAAVRAHVFLGVPGAFSAGNDMQDFLDFSTSDSVGRDVNDFLLRLAKAKKPMLAGVDGLAIGVGATMQFHCDLTFATPQSVFRTPFTDLGLVPEAGSSLLGPAALGHQKAFALLAMGRAFSAEEALASGLIVQIVEAARLEESVMAAADEIASKPPEAMQLARELLRMPREAVLDRIMLETRHFAERLKSAEARAALEAFVNRKK